MAKYDWDHIDPDYPEDADRPYQLVCGLTNSFNLIERDRSANSSKSNRFLPWRVAKDEIGQTPVEFGDLCQFLDRETGEWVLEEFMGEWFKAQTRELCGEHFAGCRTRDEKTGIHSPGTASKGGQIGGTYPWWHNPKTGETIRSLEKPGPGWINKRPIDWSPNKNLTPEEIRKKCQAANANIRPETLSKGGVNAGKKRYLCLVSGFISNAPTVAHVQKRKGINKSFRVSLDLVYFLVRSLCLVQ
jgi:hypothetical protein